VVVANVGGRPLTGTVTVFPIQGPPKPVPIDVGPATRKSVRLADAASSPFASAVVELNGGEAVAELTTSGPLGDSVAQCASASSDRWYFADGVTTKDASETILLFNPFPDDALVDVTFTTDEGQISPEALTGATVAGRATLAVSVGDNAQRRPVVSTSVTARTGRLVAARLQAFDGSAGRKGISIALGAAAPSEVWYFPEGRVSDGLVERFHLFNPQNREVRVELGLALEQGAAEPLIETIPPNSQVTVTANDEARIPKDVGHAVTVRSINGVGVVAERTIDATQQGKRTGVAITLGGRAAALRWAVAAGQADDSVDEWLVFQNPGVQPAKVSVFLEADGHRQPINGLQGLDVAPGARRAVKVNDSIKRDATPMVIEATGGVVVEQDLYRWKTTGMSMLMAVQLRG
jgi:hypothetical protein